jgi:undecaprenyl phosphate-alpha-L-ara4N flippase subunit ArnE
VAALIPLGGSVLLNAVAQISLRHSATLRDSGQSHKARVWVLSWAVTFSLATVLWIAVVRNADISYAYPMLGSGYVLITLLAGLFLRERISLFRWAAILVITAGVAMVGVNQ